MKQRNNKKLIEQKMLLEDSKAVLLALNHILLETGLKVHIKQV